MNIRFTTYKGRNQLLSIKLNDFFKLFGMYAYHYWIPFSDGTSVDYFVVQDVQKYDVDLIFLYFSDKFDNVVEMQDYCCYISA